MVERQHTQVLRRTFSLEDQKTFALLSGDHNPLHVDPLLARRYLFGQPVVHEVHALLWGLDCLLAGQPGIVAVRELRATFLKPNGLDMPVEWLLRNQTTDGAKFELRSQGAVSSKVSVSWTGVEPRGLPFIGGNFPEVPPPAVISENEIEKTSGVFDLALESETARRLFPTLAASLSPLSLATLLATSRLVGSECPGLHSIFSELRLSACTGGTQERFHYRVSEYDPRFRLVTMEIDAPDAIGSIKAFVRPSPQEQASCATLKGLVRTGEFAEQRALVIGGSRGLGEITAKLLAVGGAEVALTYSRGKEDAERVVADIAASNGRASALRLEVSRANYLERIDLPVGFAPSHIYYFATPVIRASSGVFDQELFQRFCGIYLAGFAQILQNFHSPALRAAFWPSSVYVDEFPDGMTEYAASKVAGETLCRALERTFRGVLIYRPRMPRLATDQTLSLSGPPAPNPTLAMLAELRAMRRG